MAIPTALIEAGAQIAASLISELVQTWMSGGDMEPIISRLPPEAQEIARRALEDAETVRQLQEVRDKYITE